MSWATIAPKIASVTGVEIAVAIIVAIFLVITVRMMVELTPRRGKLREAVAQLKRFESEAEFADGFEDFNAWAEQHPLLDHSWREFVETLIMPREGEPHRIGNVLPAEDAFSRQSVLRGVNLRFYASFPNVLTGLGILGTFIGLVAGISLAGRGLQSPSLEEMRQALAGLLEGASLAFFTSIAGLSCSIVFNGIEKRQVNTIDNLLRRWCSALDALVHRVTPESLADESLREAREQRRQLERFNTELALQIAAALDERIAGRLAPQVDRLIEAVEGLRTDQGESIKDALAGIVEGMTRQFQQAFTGAAGSEMQQLAQSLKSVSEKLESSAGTLSKGHNLLTSDLTVFSQQMQEGMSAFVAELAGQRAEEKQALAENLLKVQVRTAELLGEVRTTFNAVGDQLSEVSASWKQNQADQNAKSSAHLDQMLGATGLALDDVLGKLAATATMLQDGGRGLSSTLNESSDRAAKVLADSIDRAESLVQQTSRVIESAVESAALLNGYLGDLKAVHDALANTSRELGGLPDRVSATIRAFDQASRPLVTASQALDTAADAIRDEHQQMEKTFSDYERRFEGVDLSAQRLFTEINSGLEAYTARVRGFTTDLESKMKEALSTLSGAIADLDESIEELGARLPASGPPRPPQRGRLT